MKHGKSLRLYLADGSPTGIRYAEIVNWTGQAVAAPRTRYAELKNWQEVRRPGVYFLVGLNEESNAQETYIGESENVLGRLSDHVRDKDFWQECIIFTSKDENLTKGHIKYLESKLVALADIAARYNLDNSDRPPSPALPRPDADAMDEFIEYIRIMLGALGYPIIEPLPQVSEKSTNGQTIAGAKFEFRGTNFSATGTLADEGFIVLSGSQIAKDVADSTPKHIKLLREQAYSESTIRIDGSNHVFTSDYLFNSPSAAACFVAGNSRNGRDAWLDSDGNSIRKIEESSAGDSDLNSQRRITM